MSGCGAEARSSTCAPHGSGQGTRILIWRTNGQVKQVSQLPGAVVIGDIPVEGVLQSQQIGNVMPVLVQAVLLGSMPSTARARKGVRVKSSYVRATST
jgi:hypothetical protein